MTATVTAGATPLAGGTVTFRDTYNGMTQVLGTIQVQSANGTIGNAVLKQELGGVGTHSIVATFNAPKTYSASSSAAQSATLTGMYATVANLSFTGLPGNYSLTATVMGAGSNSLSPTGNVSFLDTTNSNYLLGIAGLGAGTITQQMSAGSTSPVAVGKNPEALAAGDFNSDGFIDFAVVNSNDNTISVLLANGSGGFTATGTTYATGNQPVAIVAGDFNGDGKLDLAVLNSNDRRIGILLGNGDGTFNTQSTYALSPSDTPVAIAIGDFNGDGILDLAVAGNNHNSVYIMLGDGTGAFPVANVSQINVGNSPASVVAGDFNGDGNLDFAVANQSADSISVMLGGGDGSTFTNAFRSPISTGGGTTPTALVTTDFNADGKLDLAVTDSGAKSVGIFKGNGDGTFTAEPIPPATGTKPVSIVAGDFNADGNVDLAVVNQSSNSVSLFLGKGDFTFQTPTTASVGNTPLGIAAASYGDGTIDLAVANTGSKSVSILLNQVTDTASALLTGVSVPGSGTHLVDASYAGDTNFGPSTSNTVPLTATATIATSTLLSASTTSPSYGQQVVLTATLIPSSVGSLTPSGTVTFKDSGTSIGTGSVSGGVATLNTTSLGVGTHSITATYAGNTNFIASTSPPLGVVVGKGTPVITWANPSSITYGTLLSSTQLNATSPVAGTFAYSQAAYTLLPVGTYTISTTFIPTDSTDYTIATSSVTLVVNPATPQIYWPTPAPISFGTPLSGIQLDATVAVYTQVPLTSSYNVNGIYTDGSSFSTGGFDGTGAAYSSNLLGTSVTWNNITYSLGPTNAPDAVANTTVPLPAGHYATLNLLGALVNGNVTTASTFIVTYTDGTTTTVSQHLSDWVFPLNYPGETVITCVPYRNNSNGTTDAHLTCVFGYQISLDSTKIVQSVTLPATRNNVFLAMSLVTPPIPGTLAYNPPSGTVLPTGENTLSATFTPTDQTDFTALPEACRNS
jgi:hypothetical protein